MTSLFLGRGLGGAPDFTGSGGAKLVDAVFVSLSESEVVDGLIMSRTANHRSWTSPERLSWNTMIAAVLDLIACKAVHVCMYMCTIQ